MQIDAVDFFYLALPEIRDIADGSQDAVLVRVRAGQYEGWGECEASPLTTIASLVCPLSHAACKPVRDSVLGQRLDEPADIARIGALVRANSLDLLQADHTLSGIDIALWDLMGKRFEQPIWRLLGYAKAYAKLPYASVLFGDTAAATLAKGRRAREDGFRAVKFGWGPFGRTGPKEDQEQLVAAREGIGQDGILLVDAGTAWGDDVPRAAKALRALRLVEALWLEEPFATGALSAYAALAQQSGRVKLAAGEGCHTVHMARQLLDYAGVGYIQIDAGRIGGISAAKQVADLAAERGVTYVNHTFTSHLALSASLQPYAGLADHILCEYPVELSALARDLTREHLLAEGEEGRIYLPDAPGHGMMPDLDAVRRYVVDVEIKAHGRLLYRTPEV